MTATVQDAEDVITVPRLAPDRLKLVAPETAVTVPPVQVVVGLGVGATVQPDGKGSVIASPVNSAALAARVMVTVIRVTPLRATVVGRKALETVSGAATLTVAAAATLLLPLLVCRPLTAMVLVRVPVAAVLPT